MIDAAFASGPPFDFGAERFSALELASAGAGSTGTWDGNVTDPDGEEIGFTEAYP